MIRATQSNMLRYRLTKVIETKKGMYYVEQGDAWGGERWYMKSGKSCDHPTGQSHLIVPTVEVLKWIEEHPRGDTKFETGTNQTVALDVVRRPKSTLVHEVERYMRCRDCSEVRGYPYK